jgi:hypothetical protein
LICLWLIPLQPEYGYLVVEGQPEIQTEKS